MTKLILEPGRVMNLGGYIVESRAKLPWRDVVIGNPTKDNLKLTAPILDAELLKEYERMGVIVEPIAEGESLKAKLEKVEAEVKKKVGKTI